MWMVQELDELSEQINKNNAAIVEKTNILRDDIIEAIEQIKGKNYVLAAGTCMCVIAVICCAVFVLFVYDTYIKE